MEEKGGGKKGLTMLKKSEKTKKGLKIWRVKNVEEDKTKKGLRIWKRGEEERKG